jgi:deazaflavin-dependent oxidoreductase (nitroreductase family)
MLYGPKHVERYEATDGEEGHIWEKGSTVGILTTIGRKSGEPRKTPLIYGKHGDDPIVIASNGGTDQPPSWYQNLQASPEAEFQILGDRFKVRPRDANPEEKPDLWKQMTDQWPDYDEYQKLTDREIPVVILERA